MSDQGTKRATRSTRGDAAAKPTTGESSTAADKQPEGDKDNESGADTPPHDQLGADADPDLEDVVIDYEALLKKEKERSKQFAAKREYELLLRENQKLQAPLRDDEVSAKHPRHRRGDASDSETLEGDQRSVKRQRSALDLRPAHLDNYYGKNFKEWKDWTRSAKVTFESSPKFFPTENHKVRWCQPYLRDSPATRWDNYKEANPTVLDTWTFEQFAQYLVNLMESPENRRLTTAAKYSHAKQGPTQSVSDFVAYLETLEADLEAFTELQKRDTLLNKLRDKTHERVIVVPDLPVTRDALAALVARIEDATTSRGDNGNRSQRPSQGSRSTSRGGRFGNESSETAPRADSRGPPQRGRRGGTTTLPLRGGASTGARSDETRTCYNCGQKGHISPDCSSPKKDNPQVNAAATPKPSTARTTHKAPPPQRISEVSDSSEN